MKKMQWVFPLTIALLLHSQSARSEEGVIQECRWFEKSKPFAMCITRVEGSRSRDILWYWHGASGSEKKWLKRFKPIRDEWRRMGVDIPVTVNISFGPYWLMAEKNKKATSGVIDYIEQTVMPAVENQIFGGPLTGRRLVMGESMGGFNVTQLVMRSPEAYDRAAVLCPAITSYGPHSPMSDVHAFIHRNQANWFAVYWSIIGMRVFFPDSETWARQDPLAAGPEKLGPHTPPLYLSCGRADYFGFHEGAEKFAQIARSRGVDLTWESHEGSHCMYNPRSVASFLAGLPVTGDGPILNAY